MRDGFAGRLLLGFFGTALFGLEEGIVAEGSLVVEERVLEGGLAEDVDVGLDARTGS